MKMEVYQFALNFKSNPIFYLEFILGLRFEAPTFNFNLAFHFGPQGFFP